MREKKIGILGGTFDPIHYGHLILCQTAYERFDLDFVLLMPSNNPPHKSDHAITDAVHRKEMVRLAIASDPRFFLTRFEMERDGYTYTSDTLRLLHEKYPDTHFYFIMGADSVYDFHKWRHPEEIAVLCTLLVSNRSENVTERLKATIGQIREDYHADIRLLDIPGLDISSHMLRDKLEAGESISYYTPECVIDYIREHSLYQKEK